MSEGHSHDFPVETPTMAHCPEHGVRIVWKDPPVQEAPAPHPAIEPAT
ncbi:hypothetical protein ACIRD6_35835 [Streptomyces sp. NPDC102473]